MKCKSLFIYLSFVEFKLYFLGDGKLWWIVALIPNGYAQFYYPHKNPFIDNKRSLFWQPAVV